MGSKAQKGLIYRWVHLTTRGQFAPFLLKGFIMLTSKKIEKIQAKFVKTVEEQIILALFEHSGVMKLKELAEAIDLEKKKTRLHVRKSFYMSMKDDIVKLERKGRDLDGIYEDSMDANSIDNFVYSELDKDFDQSFKVMSSKVKLFCSVKNLDSSGFLANMNIYSTQRKQFKKYLISKGRL